MHHDPTTLLDQIPTIRALSRVRDTCAEERDCGLRGLSRLSELTSPDNILDTLIFRRIKALSHHVGLPIKDAAVAPIPNLEIISILRKSLLSPESWEQIGTSSAHVDFYNDFPAALKDTHFLAPNTTNQAAPTHYLARRTPVFLATSTLRAQLDHPFPHRELAPEEGDSDFHVFWHSLYVILRELYYAHEPDWGLGGVRAGCLLSDRATVSGFMTCEASRSLGRFVNTLTFTDAIVKNLSSSLQHIATTKAAHDSLPPGSRTNFAGSFTYVQASHFRNLQTLAALSPARSLVDISDIFCTRRDTDEIHTLIDHASNRISVVLRNFSSALDDVITTISDDYACHTDAPTGDGHANFTIPLPHVQSRSTAAHGAHYSSSDALLSARSLFAAWKSLQSAPTERDPTKRDPDDDPTRQLLERSASGVSRHLDLIARHCDAQLSQNLTRLASSKVPVDVHEVAFYAATFGYTSKRWEDPRLTTALRVVSDSFDIDQGFPFGKPFFVAPSGIRLAVANAHIVRAWAQLISHAPSTSSQLVLDTATRILQHFSANTIRDPEIKDNERLWSRRFYGSRQVHCGWVSGLSVIGLHRLESSLSSFINAMVSEHIETHPPQKSSAPRLQHLIPTDTWLRLPSTETSDCMASLRIGSMAARLSLPLRGNEHLCASTPVSAILFGPPGTGKTTLAQSVAGTSASPLYEVTPSTFLALGTERLEPQAQAIMDALSALRGAVILFDEFENVLASRDPSGGNTAGATRASSTLDFLTASMLPKLAKLRKAAETGRSVFILATNYIAKLDSAAIRPGRFDYKTGVYHIDPIARAWQLLVCLHINAQARDDENAHLDSDGHVQTHVLDRLALMAIGIAQAPMPSLISEEWLSPKGHRSLSTATWKFIFDGDATKHLRWPEAMPSSVSAGENSSTLQAIEEAESGRLDHVNRKLLTLLNNNPTGKRPERVEIPGLWQSFLSDVGEPAQREKIHAAIDSSRHALIFDPTKKSQDE